MAAQITGNSTSATVASVKLRASVSTVVPVVGLTRVYPIADVAYILLAVSAYLDTTGRFKYTTDVFSVADAATLSTSKMADADTFSLADSQVFSTDKAVTDTTTIGDSVLTVLIFIRQFDDTTSLADAKTLLISPAYSDTFTTSETTAFSISKALSDSFALNDLSDANGPDWSFSDYTNNTVSTSDSATVTNTKGLSDSLSSSDSGTLISQGYCDITYFAEDYVGDYRTF
jgi:hypothetical protein